MGKITEQKVAEKLLDEAFLLVTQTADNVESLRRIPLPVLLKKFGYADNGILYYASVTDAVNDINSGIISNAGNGESVMLITNHSGERTVVLLDDVVENTSVIVNKNLDIALNGHTLCLTGEEAVLQFAADTDCTIWGGCGQIIKKNVASSDKIFLLRADGAMLSIRETEIGLNAQAGTFAMAVRAAGGLVDMEDCHIESNNTADGGAWALQASAGEIVAKRCTIQVSNIGNKTGHQFNDAIGIVSGAKVTMEDSSIIATSQKGYATGIKAFVGSSTDLIDTTISVVTNTDGSLSAAIGVRNHAGATLRVDGGKIMADAPGDSTPEDYAIGVENGGVCHLKNANISGTHSAVSNDANGKLYVDGGLYTGYSHGGFYFAHGADGVAYVNDATVRDGHYEGIFTDVFDGSIEGVEILGGFYIGGGSGDNNSNMAVYLDGCTFDVTNRAFVLRGTDGETNNTVNISNSTVLDAANHPIRIDNDTMRVNIGIGGNITPDVALTHESEDASAWASLTNRLYRYKHNDPDYMALANAAVIAPNKANIGDIMRVKAVDEDGKPVEWECVDLPTGGSEEKWELLFDTTLEEEVKSIEAKFLDNPQKKIYAVLDTLAADADTNYMPANIWTGTANWTQNINFYPKAMPMKTPQRSVIEAEVFDDLTAIVKASYGTVNDNAGTSKVSMDAVKYSEMFLVPVDSYGNPINPRITAITTQTYGTFVAGTRLRVWGVAK